MLARHSYGLVNGVGIPHNVLSGERLPREESGISDESYDASPAPRSRRSEVISGSGADGDG